jgi:oxygen-independent coproporphyrinogen-3 oxidase
VATLRRKKPENWISRVEANGHGIESEEDLAPSARATEALLMGLRLEEGVDLARIAIETGIHEDRLIDHRATDRLASQGLIHQQHSRLRVTAPGMLLLDAILGEIVAASD